MLISPEYGIVIDNRGLIFFNILDLKSSERNTDFMKHFVSIWLILTVIAASAVCASAQSVKLFADQAFQPSL